MLENKEYNFLKKTKKAFTISIILIVISISAIFIKGFNFGIDFTGGVIFDINITDSNLLSKIKNDLSINYKDNLFQSYNDGVIVKISKKDINNKNSDIQRIIDIIKTTKSDVVFNKIDFVEPQVGSILIKNGIISMLIAFIGILFYIWIRFELSFGISAIIGLLHDIIILFGFISICNLDFDLTTIAAILTVIGYSINDTVVIFDRIRENLKIYKGKNINNIINISINTNLKRTLYTSVSTLLAILPLTFSSIVSLKVFGIVIVFGILIGTYSSIFIASPILVYKNRLNRSKNEKN